MRLKPSEVRMLPAGELQTRIEDMREELFKLRFQAKLGEVADTSRLREARRDLARILTILRERQFPAATEYRSETTDE